jgi:dGTPase
MLPHLRFRVEASRGRRYPELEHRYRNAFQRDRDRVIHARAFRRLENKTQVFSPEISDHFRNRLTHTLEVSQIARTVANVLELDEDLTEALSLAHDIGHPPFAHAGEEELDRQMRRFGERFDHNIQALRTVEHLEQRYPRFPGLNLTFEVREGMVKHSHDFEPGEIPALDEYLAGLRPPLEAQLIDLADEIAYNAADLDDAFEAGLIDATRIAADVPAWAEILERVETQYPGATKREQFQESVRELIDGLVSGLIEGTVAAANAAQCGNVEDVRRFPERIARFTEAAGETSRTLKRFLHAKVYESETLERDRTESMRRLGALFEYLMSHPEDVPEDCRRPEAPHHGVCDYMAGMTDRYFNREYERVFVPKSLRS